MGLAHCFQDERFFFFLDSSQQPGEQSRFSFIGFDPFELFHSKDVLSLPSLKRKHSLWANRLKDILRDHPTSRELCQSLPLCPGLTGLISYDYGLYSEPIPLCSRDDLHLPDVCFGFYDFLITLDHQRQELYVASTGFPEVDLQKRKTKAQRRIDQIVQKIDEERDFFEPIIAKGTSKATLNFKSNFTREKYQRAVRRALDYITQGDIYQVNLSQRFTFTPEQRGVHPFDIYRHLRRLSPCPFGGYFKGGLFQLLSNSPERFLRLRFGHLETRPMKGTMPRGRTTREDVQMRRKILESRKDQAELLMITDLERNDLGRVCQYGSVQVTALRTLEAYPHVYQTTSTIEGRLMKDKDCFDVLQACFPGGSITGCPKIRAMEIIEELEPTRRGPYTGSMGYIDYLGNMDFNILIRTLIAVPDKYYFQVGGGIVADSTPEKEYQETLIKASAMRQTLEDVFGHHFVMRS